MAGNTKHHRADAETASTPQPHTAQQQSGTIASEPKPLRVCCTTRWRHRNLPFELSRATNDPYEMGVPGRCFGICGAVAAADVDGRAPSVRENPVVDRDAASVGAADGSVVAALLPPAPPASTVASRRIGTECLYCWL